MTPDLEASVVLSFKITQPFEGVGLRVFYLAEWVRCQLVSKDAPQVPMDPLEFMVALLSMTDVEYAL